MRPASRPTRFFRQAVGTPGRRAFHAGLLLIVALRLGGIYGGWHLPVLRLAD